MLIFYKNIGPQSKVIGTKILLPEAPLDYFPQGLHQATDMLPKHRNSQNKNISPIKGYIFADH